MARQQQLQQALDEARQAGDRLKQSHEALQTQVAMEVSNKEAIAQQARERDRGNSRAMMAVPPTARPGQSLPCTRFPSTRKTSAISTSAFRTRTIWRPPTAAGSMWSKFASARLRTKCSSPRC